MRWFESMLVPAGFSHTRTYVHVHSKLAIGACFLVVGEMTSPSKCSRITGLSAGNTSLTATRDATWHRLGAIIMRSRRRHRFWSGFSLTPVSEYLECKVLLSADVIGLPWSAPTLGDTAEAGVVASLATTEGGRGGESSGGDVQAAPVSPEGVRDSSTSPAVALSVVKATEESAISAASGSRATATALAQNETSSSTGAPGQLAQGTALQGKVSSGGRSTASDVYPGDDASAAPVSGLSAADAAASQATQNGNATTTDLNAIDDTGGLVSQVPLSNSTSTITASIGGITAGGATTTGAGAISPVAAQNGPSAPMVATASGATITGTPGSTGNYEGGREAAGSPTAASIVATPDRALQVTELTDVSQPMNPAAMVSANGGLVSGSSVDVAVGVPQARLSLDGLAALIGLTGSLEAEGFLTRPADLLTEFLPFDRASVENAIDQFLEGFEGLSASLPTDMEVATIMSAGSFLMAIAAASTMMVVRRRSGPSDRTATDEGMEKALGRIFNLTHS
jgi:hypothetical protein